MKPNSPSGASTRADRRAAAARHPPHRRTHRPRSPDRRCTVGLPSQKLPHVGDDEPVVEPGARAPARPSSATGRRRAASRHAAGRPRRRARCRSRDRACVPKRSRRRRHAASTASRNSAGAAIGEVRKRAIEARRVLVEQRAHIAARSAAVADRPRRAARDAAPRRGGPPGRARAPVRTPRRAPVAIAERLARLAEREPGRGEAAARVPSPARTGRRRPRGRRRPHSSRASSYAPVGDQVARGDEQRQRLRRIFRARNRADMTYLSVMRPEDILKPTPAGLCCQIGGFHIDPVRPVDKALITHGHSDHARAGHGAVLATPGDARHDAPALRRELRRLARRRSRYGETLTIGGVAVSFHPAGHVLGSAQIAVARERHARGRVGRLQGRGGPDLRAVRAGPLRRLHHRGDLRPAGVPPRRSRAPRSPSCCARSRCFPSARIWSAPIRSARRSA